MNPGTWKPIKARSPRVPGWYVRNSRTKQYARNVGGDRREFATREDAERFIRALNLN